MKEEKAAAGEPVSVEKQRSLDFIAIGERNRTSKDRSVNVTMEEWEALLLEIARRAAETRIGPQRGVPVPIPIEVLRVAKANYDGKELALAIAAAAAVVALGLAVGPGGPAALPKALGSVARGGVFKGGFGGMLFQTSELFDAQTGPLRKITQGAGAGEFFPGILG